MEFKLIKPTQIKENIIKLIGNDWMLITAGTPENYNTMTASWGCMGELWNKHVVFIFIRPQRFTYEFVEREDFFTCSFFDESYRGMLNFCGAKSGRDYNKAKEANITPVVLKESVSFNEARIVIECRKIYYQDIDPHNFISDTIEKHYPRKDYHRMFVGEITSVWIKND
jgi:flavin reductase (DIM6/NTAB) family NADH-FMN oxidoreductase RutF